MENVRRYKKEEDGRICEDRVKEMPLSDGKGRMQIKEQWEEKVPMSLKSRTSSKIIEVPVEVRTEVLDENGNVVDEHVEVISSDSIALRNERDATSLHDLKQEIKCLAERISTIDKERDNMDFSAEEEGNKNVKVKSCSIPSMQMMDSKYGNSANEKMNSDNSWGSTIGQMIIWVGVAAAAAVFVYNVII